MKEKKCSHCKDLFPATTEYFFKKVTKKGTIVNGYALKEDSISLRHICKKCHSQNINNKKREKRRILLGLEVYDKEKSFKHGGFIKLKYKETSNMSPNDRLKYHRFVKSGMSIEEYKIHLKTYGKNNLKKATEVRIKKLSSRLSLSEIARCRAANNMRVKTEDFNDDLYLLYVKHIKFYRNVKNYKNNQSIG